MNAHDAIKIGEEIALKHKKNVLEIIEMGATPEKALDGCIVSLAANIMVVLNRAKVIKPDDVL